MSFVRSHNFIVANYCHRVYHEELLRNSENEVRIVPCSFAYALNIVSISGMAIDEVRIGQFVVGVLI